MEKSEEKSPNTINNLSKSLLKKVNQKRFGKKGKKMEKPEKFFLMEIYMK